MDRNQRILRPTLPEKSYYAGFGAVEGDTSILNFIPATLAIRAASRAVKHSSLSYRPMKQKLA